MKKLTVALLIGVLALVPALAVAQTGGGAGGTQAPSSPEKPGGKAPSGSAPSTGSGAPSGSSPSASPPGASDMSKILSKADCDKAGGMWTESTKTCAKR